MHMSGFKIVGATVAVLATGATAVLLLSPKSAERPTPPRFMLSVAGLSESSQLDLNSLDCPSTKTCVAAGSLTPSGSDSFVTRSVFLVLDGLKVESAYVGPGGKHSQASSVSCSSVSSCVAIGTENAHEGVWTLSGGKWTYRSLSTANSLEAISCTTSRFCMAVGQANSGSATAWRYDGRHWNPMSLGVRGSASLLRCVSASFCVTSGTSGPYSASLTAPITPWVSTFDGTAWRTVSVPLTRPRDSGGNFESLTCGGASLCIAGGSEWSGNSVLRSSSALEDSWNGSDWSANETGSIDGVPDAQVIDDAVCMHDQCEITGESGSFDDRYRFQVSVGLGRPLVTRHRVGAGNLENGLALSGCATDGSCQLIVPGDIPNADGPYVYFSIGSLHVQHRLDVPDSISYLDALSCATSQWCMAVGGINWSVTPGRVVPVLVSNGRTFHSEYLLSRKQ
jgi:hypothetical protein